MIARCGQRDSALEMAGRLKVFRDPETHPAAHYRLMEMLMEIGIRSGSILPFGDVNSGTLRGSRMELGW